MFHQFSVSRGHTAGAPHRLEMSVASAPVLVPTVSGACLSLWSGPTPKTPFFSCETSTAAPNPVAACHVAASSPPRRHPHQPYLRSTRVDRGDHSRPQVPPLRIRGALLSNETPRAPRNVTARRRLGFTHLVAARSCWPQPELGPVLPGQHRTAPARPLHGVSWARTLAQPSLQSHSRGAVRYAETPQTPRHPRDSIRMNSCGSLMDQHQTKPSVQPLIKGHVHAPPWQRFTDPGIPSFRKHLFRMRRPSLISWPVGFIVTDHASRIALSCKRSPPILELVPP